MRTCCSAAFSPSSFRACSARTPTSRSTPTRRATRSRRWRATSRPRPATRRGSSSSRRASCASPSSAWRTRSSRSRCSAATTSRASRCAASAAPAASTRRKSRRRSASARVIIHPLAGVLSAYGIGVADVRVLRQASVEAPLDDGARRDAGRPLRARSRADARSTRCASKAPTAGRRCGSSGACSSRSPEPIRRLPVAWHAAAAGAELARGVSRAARAALRLSRAARTRRSSSSRSSSRPSLPGSTTPPAAALPPAQPAAAREADRAPRRLVRRRWRNVPVYDRAQLAGRRAVHGAGADRRSERHDDRRARLARRGSRDGHSAADAHRPARAARGARPRRRSRHARGVQQPLHARRRGDGHRARAHGPLGQHQGAARLLVRAVRGRRRR